MLGPGLQSVTCAGTAACACTVAVLPSDNNEAGTYTVSGTFFTTTAAGDTAFVTHDTCVQGNTMHLVSLDPTMTTGPSGQPAIIYDIVAQRR